MTLEEFLQIGRTVVIGAHRLETGEILHFARKYDPQLFHTDEEAARKSVLGGLCASGWHTCALWMKYNVAAGFGEAEWQGEGPAPIFGPSPGFRDLRWLKPAYAGDTLTFARQSIGFRPLTSRPGWYVLNGLATADNQEGERVMSFESAVLFHHARHEEKAQSPS
ncbi:MaoC family dehydratase [Nitratireductor basaltis]|uniref:MaoC-like dehydratase n=1 Tax=Nitratireductor basaltis TaxID=472175 RepID=A0A084U945_9HYPH|nr:MaoC family dehydratase [Nitratireductor basaltis]KFB09481.1 MaoC-like dehydratase [Nitratireductor basaltis]